MYKYYSRIFMFALLFTALCFSACSSSSDDEAEGGSSGGEKTLNFNGEWYYCGSLSSVEQTKSSGMYLNVYGTEHPQIQWNGHVLTMRIKPCKVAELSQGETIDGDQILVQEFRLINEIVYDTYTWRVIDGSITFEDIREKDLTLRLNDLVLESKRTGVERTIYGRAVLKNSVSDNNGVKPF